MSHDRRPAAARAVRAAARAVRELDDVITGRRAELAALERARDVLERQLAEHPDRCNNHHTDSPCAGQIFSRWCDECGAVVLRCDQHGGIRGATHAARLHRDEAHPGSDAGDPAADDPGRVPAGGQAVPLGELQAPPAARGRRDQGR
jgi:hypothetical protein